MVFIALCTLFLSCRSGSGRCLQYLGARPCPLGEGEKERERKVGRCQIPTQGWLGGNGRGLRASYTLTHLPLFNFSASFGSPGEV